MSVKDVTNYYNQVYENYKAALECLVQLDKEAEEKIISPQQVEEYKKIFAPIMDTFKEVSYFVYLLNMPNKHGKKPKYVKGNKKNLENNPFVGEKVLAEGQKIIKEFKK